MSLSPITNMDIVAYDIVIIRCKVMIVWNWDTDNVCHLIALLVSKKVNSLIFQKLKPTLYLNLKIWVLTQSLVKSGLNDVVSYKN